MNFDFKNIFGGGFNNNNFGRTNYGFGNAGWSGNNYGTFEKGGYGGNAVTLPNLNTQSNSPYGASFASNAGGWGNAGGFGFNTGWGNRSNESGRYSNYVNQQPDQPYNRFLIEGFNPGFEQFGVLNARLDRQARQETINGLGKVGFWQPSWPNYPQSLYNV
jgi:hypothetical protein